MDRQTVNCTETSQNGLTETEKLINQHMDRQTDAYRMTTDRLADRRSE